MPPDPVVAEPKPSTIRRGATLLRPLAAWHRYEVRGMEHVPRTGACLMVAHHSLATYDGFLLGAAIIDATGRVPRGLGDRRLFQPPGIRDLWGQLGLVPASPTAGQELLARGEIVGVAPGGMWESLRPRQERHQVRWQGRRGFCRLALRAGVPLMLCACPAADEIYTVYGSRLTDALYRRRHIPLPFARGWGPTLIPRPLKLVHHIAPLLHPPAHDAAREDEQIDALHAQAKAVMLDLLGRS